MKLAVVFGDKSEKLAQMLSSVKDDYKISPFNSIDDMITNSTNRGYLFDRVLVLSTIVKRNYTEEINKLAHYFREFAPSTNIILLCQQDESDIVSCFTQTFKSNLCASLSVSSISINMLVEVSSSQISEVRKKYGIDLELDVEIEEDVIELPKPEVPQVVISKPKKKLFGGLFGKGKENIANSNIQDENTTSEEESEDDSITESISDDATLGTNTDSQVDEMEEMNEDLDEEVLPDFEDNMENDEFITDDATLTDEEDLDIDFDEDSEDELEEENLNQDIGVDENEEMPDFDSFPLSDNGDSIEDTDNEIEDTEENFDNFDSFPINDNEEDVLDEFDALEEESPQETVKEEIELLEIEYDLQEEFNLPKVEEDEPKFTEVEEDSDDFFIIDLSEPSPKPSSIKTTENKTSVVQDEDDLDGLSVADFEKSYKSQTEPKPKVVEKIVEKEVVREIIKEVPTKGAQSIGVLSSILAGKTTKILLFTGDRGSGITTTAWDVATTLAKKIPVLYFDGDIDTHGLLNYIEYDQFAKYEETQLSGVKYCKSSKAYSNCALRYDTNIDLLSSNYGIQISDAELEATQSVVAEIAHNYGVVIVDAPIDKLHLFQDLILQGNIVMCVEATKRGIMNMLCKIEDSPLPLRYKRSIMAKGTMILTKVHPKLDMSQLLKYVRHIVELDEVDWLGMRMLPRTEKDITVKFLEEILEG